MPPIVLINAVGLTPRLLEHAPRLKAVATSGWQADMPEVLPAVTCTAQATLLTGKPPSEHGIVANGWLFRDTNEVRFWQQSNRLIQAEPLYATARKRAKERGKPFTSAKLFWWFNQGAAVDLSVTPKPHYAVNGDKAFGITGTPQGEPITEILENLHGPFPFPAFWGPMAGRKSTQWIAATAADVVSGNIPCLNPPDLTLVYLPHLDYDPQRFGPSGTDMPRRVKELDDAAAPLLDAAKTIGAQVWVVSEYGHGDVTRPVYVNRVLRSAGLLDVRGGPFGEQLDLYGSRAFAVVDHQLAHVYVREPEDIARVRDLLTPVQGVARVATGNELHLNHSRSGELILLAEPDAWFAYPFWMNDPDAPDYARAVEIHHKPGFDPCELFFDPKFTFPKLHAARRLAQKKLGFRMTMDVVSLDASIVRGSHGLAANDPLDRPVLIGHGARPGASVPMTAVKELVLGAMGLG